MSYVYNFSKTFIHTYIHTYKLHALWFVAAIAVDYRLLTVALAICAYVHIYICVMFIYNICVGVKIILISLVAPLLG